MDHLLGIDLGTSGVKALLLDRQGLVLGSGKGEYPILTPRPGWAEQDPEAWWQSAVKAVRWAISGLDNPGCIQAIGVSGQMHGTVLLDHRDVILHPAVIWPDQRAAEQVDEITKLVGLEKLIGTTGSPAAAGFQAATIRWFQEIKPDLWDQVRSMLLPKDYLRWRMTGSMASDPSDGAGSLLLDGQKRDWSSYLLKLLDINQQFLPPIKPSNSVAGKLQEVPAADLGLIAGTPVITGAADTASSLVGSGLTDPSGLMVSISSGGQLVWPCLDFYVDKTGRTHTFCSALDPGPHQAGWYKMGATLSAGQSLRWLRDNVLGLRGEDVYRKMDSWAEEAPPGSQGLIFLPHLSGERTPVMNPLSRGVLIGLTLSHNRTHLVRAVMEGVVFSLFQAYQTLTGGLEQPERIILTGGGAKSEFWSQMTADVFGLPVQKLVVEEGSAMGAALLAGAGLGLYDAAQQSRKWAAYAAQQDPNLENHESYLELYEMFGEIYRQNRDILERLSVYPGKN